MDPRYKQYKKYLESVFIVFLSNIDFLINKFNNYDIDIELFP